MSQSLPFLMNMSRGAFRTQESIYDGAFFVNIAIKAPSQMFDWVIHRPLKILKFSK